MIGFWCLGIVTREVATAALQALSTVHACGLLYGYVEASRDCKSNKKKKFFVLLNKILFNIMKIKAFRSIE